MARTKQQVNRTRPHPRDTGTDSSTRRVVGILVAVVAVVVLVYVGWSIANDPQRAIEARTAELQEEEAQRDQEQITDLTAQAREVAGDLTVVLEGMVQVLPPGEAPGPVADADTVSSWQETTAAVAATFEDPPSGATGTNVARNALAVAAGMFQAAADTYALALDAEGAQQEAILERAATQRDLAVRSWSIGATQLDEINILAGNGHQHVYLEAEGTGALTPDGAAEGEDAHGPAEGEDAHSDG